MVLRIWGVVRLEVSQALNDVLKCFKSLDLAPSNSALFFFCSERVLGIGFYFILNHQDFVFIGLVFFARLG